ncbi:DUF5666 domain-containing protein [Vibrio rotiferianus]|uniref:DUF5666 domain-containing protein n=1 Tax=Vibrio rotiferianus TaxID=190895 RepID=UPI00390B9BB6
MKKLALVAAVGLVLSGCGGSGDNNSGDITTPPVTNPTASTVIGSIESISGNSITVNGHKFSVANVNYQGQSLKPSVLALNMMVEVNSATKASSANVTLEPTMAGIINNIDRATGMFTINGITLKYAKLMDKDSPIHNHDWVFVSSLPTATEGYKVISVVKLSPEEPSFGDITKRSEIEGVVTDLDVKLKRMTLGSGINIEWDQNIHFDDGILPILGHWVEVEGQWSNGIFHASEIDVENYASNSSESETEGVITWVANDHSAFALNYRGKFLVNSSTRFEDGSKLDLLVGSEVEVTSVSQSNNRVATNIEFDDKDTSDDAWDNHEFECSGLVTNYQVEGVSATFDIQELQYGENAGKDCSNITINKNNAVFEDGLSFFNLSDKQVDVEGILVNRNKVALEVEAWEAED